MRPSLRRFHSVFVFALVMLSPSVFASPLSELMECGGAFSGNSLERIQVPESDAATARFRAWLEKYDVKIVPTPAKPSKFTGAEPGFAQYDPKLWHDLLVEQVEHAPAGAWETRPGFGTLIRQMPRNLRQSLLADIVEIYPYARTQGDRQLKRNLDYFLTNAINPKAIMNRNPRSLQRATEAYESFLQEQAEVVPSLAPVPYSVPEILSVARFIQGQFDQIRENAVDHQTLGHLITGQYSARSARSEAELESQDFNILIMGSFPMGRADLFTSDIDLILPGTYLADSEYRALSDGVNRSLAALGKTTNLRLSQVDYFTYHRSEVTPQSTVLKTYARISPVAVSIRKDQIELWIFDPKNPEAEPQRLPL